MSSSIELTPREMMERAWRAFPTIIKFWILTVLATLFVVFFWPRTYGSTARLYLQKGRESVGLDPTANATGNTIALQQAGRDAEIKSAIDVLASRGVIEPVVDKLTPEVVLSDVAADESKQSSIRHAIKETVGSAIELVRSIDPASDRERAVVEIEKNLEIDAERKSEIISVIYEADSPELAQMVVQAIVDEYRKKHAMIHRTEGSTEFFDEQSQRLKAELDEKSLALREAKDRMGLASIPGHRTILENQLGDIRGEMLITEKQLFAAEAKADNLAEQLNARPERLSSAETTKPNSGADMQRQLLYELQIELEELHSKFRPNHPQVRAVEQQVKKAEAELNKQQARRKETTDDINPVHAELKLDFAQNDAEIAGLRAQRKKLVSQEASLLQQIRELNAYEVEIEQLTRDVQVASKKYVTYAENLEEARVDREMHGRVSSVSVAQPATLQEKPVAPSKPITVIVGALLSIVGAIGIAFARIQVDDTLTSADAVRRHLQIPVLGVFPNRCRYTKLQIGQPVGDRPFQSNGSYEEAEASDYAER